MRNGRCRQHMPCNAAAQPICQPPCHPPRTCCTASISAGSFSRSLGAPMRTMTARRPGVFSGLSVAMRATSSEGSILSLTCGGVRGVGEGGVSEDRSERRG